MSLVSDINLLGHLREGPVAETSNVSTQIQSQQSNAWISTKGGESTKSSDKTKQRNKPPKNQVSNSGFAIVSGKSSWHKIFQYRHDNWFLKMLSQGQKARYTK